MINPVLIIAGVATILIAAVISILNHPRFPLTAGAFILVLIFFLVTTFLLDSAICDLGKTDAMSDFIKFTVLKDNPNYDDLADSFRTFMYIDMGLFAGSLIAMFTEALVILRKNSDV